MRKRIGLAIILALSLGGCATIGVGQDGRDFQLAQAEPLFGKNLDRCMDDPGTLLGIITKDESTISPNCMQLASRLSPLVRSGAETGQFDTNELNKFDRRVRNEIIDALIAVSNRKCSDYSAYLKTHDGQANASLSILSILTGGLGGFVGGADAAKALSGSSAILSGSRAALNDTWFSNQTIHVLVSGFEKVRERESREIDNRKACPIDTYSTMAGVGDALRYHGACSLLTGLSEAAEAIDRADQPGLETMRRQLADLHSISAQASSLINASFPNDPTRGIQLSDAVGTAKTLMLDANYAVKTLESRLDALRAITPTPETLDAHNMQIEKVEADLLAAQTRYDGRKTEYDTAQSTLNDFLTSELQARTDAERKRTEPGSLQGSQSRILICPFTGKSSLPTAAQIAGT